MSKYSEKIVQRERAYGQKKTGDEEEEEVAKKSAAHLQQQFDEFRAYWDNRPIHIRLDPD